MDGNRQIRAQKIANGILDVNDSGGVPASGGQSGEAAGGARRPPESIEQLAGDLRGVLGVEARAFKLNL